MSNPNSPFGFLPIGPADGSAPTFALRSAKIYSGNTNAIYRGDPVIMQGSTSGGYITPWSTNVANGLVIGVFWGCKYLSTALGRTVSQQFWPGSDAAADGVAYLIPLAGSVPTKFIVQANSSSTPIAFANIGECASPVAGTGHVKGAAGLSGFTLGTPTATTALEFKIIDLASSIFPSGTSGTDDTSAYNKVIVQFNSFSDAGHA